LPVSDQEFEKRIQQFDRDVKFLKDKRISFTEMGTAMGMDKSNFSSYRHKKIPITEDFLTKFYLAWGERLGEEAKNKTYNYNLDPQDPAESIPQSYLLKDTTIRGLVNGQTGIIKSNIILAESNKIAAEAIRTSAEAAKINAENYQKLIDHLLNKGANFDEGSKDET